MSFRAEPAEYAFTRTPTHAGKRSQSIIIFDIGTFRLEPARVVELYNERCKTLPAAGAEFGARKDRRRD